MPTGYSKEARLALTIAAVSLALRLAVALALDTFQDEALYWWQGREAGVTFTPQPPVVPLAVWAASGALGEGTGSVRLLSLLAGTATILLAWLLGRDMYGRRVGVVAALLAACCPLLVMVGSVATPEAPVVAVWLLTVWCLWRALQSGARRWWLASGAVAALALYTKYMAVLALPCGVAALLAMPEGRRQLKTSGPWLAIGLCGLLFAPPFLLWNSANGWPTFRYHLGARHTWTFDLDVLGQYLGGRAGIYSPLLWGGVLASLAALWRRWRHGDSRAALILAFGAGPILFFLGPSVFTEQELVRVHWDLIGYATALVGLASVLAERPRLLRWTVGVAALFSIVLTTVSLWPALAVKAGSRPPTIKMLGWQALTARVEDERERWSGEDPIVVAESFSTALCIAYHRGHQRDIYTLNHRRNRRYGLRGQLRGWGINEWHMRRNHAGGNALYVHELRSLDPADLDEETQQITALFHEVERLEPFDVTCGGKVVKRYALFRCTGCRGLWGGSAAGE